VAQGFGRDGSLIDAVTQATLPLAATRPADVSLDSSRARRELGWTPRPIDAAILDGRPGPA
jgi:dTDP-4-dehydrorhamnose reductase